MSNTASHSIINPLIACGDDPDETSANVRGALTFIADALNKLGGSCLPNEAAEGASLLILCCVAALEVTTS